jgi:hypothetical protein
MKTKKILSIDIDFCRSHKDFEDVFDLFCKNLFKLSEDKILISSYHVDILELIKGIGDPIEILNIDNHHDIVYERNSLCELRNSLVSSANWVGWLFIHAFVENYIWCSQELSEDFSDEFAEELKTLYDKNISYDIIDSRNLVFNSKYAVTENTSENYLKHRPKFEVELGIKKYFYDIDFDYLFVCLSPGYTPKEHYFMYDIIRSTKNRFFEKYK